MRAIRTAYTPEKIGEIKFRIPLYQRPYAWESPQVEQLLSDLFNHFSDDKNKYYYIGILSIGKSESDSGFYDLIDGQQRITTLYLIGRVFSKGKLCEKKWEQFLEDRLDLYGRDEDNTFLKELEKSGKTNKILIKAGEIIENFIKEKEKEVINDFSSFVYTKAAFFIAEIPDGYKVIDKNLHFVRMNNRGKQLEAHDILKMKMASELKKRDERSDFVKEWNRISQLGCLLDRQAEKYNSKDDPEEAKSLKSILEEYDKDKLREEPKESEIFYQSIVSFPEFLLIALARFNYGTEDKPEYLEVSHRKDKLLEVFGFGGKNVGIKWDADKVNKFKSLLCKQFSIFDNYFIKRDKENRYKFKENELFNGSVQNLLVFQSYMYVSWEPQQQHKWLVNAFNYFRKNNPSTDENKQNAEEFLTELKSIDNEEYENKKYENVDLSYPGINRYWFWRLDYYLWEDREKYFKKKETQNVADKYIFRTNRSIEHVAPQTPKSNSTVKIEDKESLHSFGNLAMISSEQNTALQNESFEIKRAHVESFIKGSKSGTIESLKLLKIFEDSSGWNNDQIKKHKEEMMKVLKDSFPNADTNKSIRESLATQISQQTETK